MRVILIDSERERAEPNSSRSSQRHETDASRATRVTCTRARVLRGAKRAGPSYQTALPTDWIGGAENDRAADSDGSCAE